MSGIKLRIVSSRTPYRRAGLAFPGREAIELVSYDLEPAQLRQILHDPVLSVSFSDDGPWHTAQQVLDGALGDGVALRLAALFGGTPAGDDQPADPGVPDPRVAELIERNQRQADEIMRHVAQIAELEQALAEAAKVIGDRNQHIDRLKAELARAAEANPKPAKAKPASKTPAPSTDR